MPQRAPTICRHPGCSTKVTGKATARYCEQHKPKWVPWGAHQRRTIKGAAYDAARKSLFERQPLCVLCERAGRVSLATIRDHTIPLAQGGVDEESNTQALCKECHDIKSAGEKRQGSRESWHNDVEFAEQAQARRLPSLPRSVIPITIVCGAPGSGKSSYVRERAREADVVIDLDDIKAELSRQPIYQCGPQWTAPALDERNRRLRDLSRDTLHRHAWFIVGAPTEEERNYWASMLGGDVVLLDTPYEECAARIQNDPRRVGQYERLMRAAFAWWDQYRSSSSLGARPPGGYLQISAHTPSG